MVFITKMYMPVINTDNNNGFNYDGELTPEKVSEIRDGKVKVDTFYNDEVDMLPMETAVFPYDESIEDVESYIAEKAESKSKMLFRINVNPTVLADDVEAELKFWMADTKEIIEHDEWGDEVKFRLLPKRDLQIIAKGNTYNLYGCKIIERNEDSKYPFEMTILVSFE